ncbi:MAG TPA: VOC family protein [Burkholderiales bacterium]|nr:VOC family protein [Burkholderiales bacterium]
MAVVRYLVADVDAALKFYEGLGFTLEERWGPPFAIVRRDDLFLWLSGPGTSAAKALADGSQPRPGGWNRLVLQVADLGQTVNRLRKLGARFRSDPIAGPGGQQVLVEDPSGNPIELFQPKERSAG